MTDTPPPQIVFPCADYPIKVLGDAVPGFREFVIQVISRHDATFDAGKVQERPSRNGRFISINVRILATGEAQLQALFEDLKGNSAVRMVL